MIFGCLSLLLFIRKNSYTTDFIDLISRFQVVSASVCGCLSHNLPAMTKYPVIFRLSQNALWLSQNRLMLSHGCLSNQYLFI